MWAKITIASAIIGIALLCLLGKMLFDVWMYRLDKKQDEYLESLDQQLQTAETSSLQVWGGRERGREGGEGTLLC